MTDEIIEEIENEEVIEKVALETKYYNNSGILFSCDSEEMLYKLFPDGLEELTEAEAKEFSLYSGTHNYVEGEWVEKTKTDEEIEALRDAAYSNVVTGSDKFFIEAYRKEKSGDTEGAASAQALGEARVAEIKAEYPFNEN